MRIKKNKDNLTFDEILKYGRKRTKNSNKTKKTDPEGNKNKSENRDEDFSLFGRVD